MIPLGKEEREYQVISLILDNLREKKKNITLKNPAIKFSCFFFSFLVNGHLSVFGSILDFGIIDYSFEKKKVPKNHILFKIQIVLIWKFEDYTLHRKHFC